MKKLNLAVIGQGRSGRNIHGAFFKKDENVYFRVAAVVEADAERRARALEEYPGCDVYESYTELFDRKDIDLVVNASYSEMHYPITLDLLEHGFNVVSEKPMGRNRFECETLIKTAKEKGVVLAVFKQSLFAPFYKFTKELIASGRLGEIQQVSIRYNGFSRRWDWQTLQCKLAGSVYNTGPHPIGYACDLLGFSDDIYVPYSRLVCTDMTSGDGEDYAKIIITAPGCFAVDLEISSLDAFSDYNIKLQGTKGTFKITASGKYTMKYIVDGENPERPIDFGFLKDENGLPVYCSEKLVTHTEEGTVSGSAFDAAVEEFYGMVYDTLENGAPLRIKPENIAQVVGVIETVHAQNPLKRIY